MPKELTEEQKEKRRQYNRQYYKAHRDVLNNHHSEWQKNNKDKMKKLRESYRARPELAQKMRDYQKEYRESKHGKMLKKQWILKKTIEQVRGEIDEANK